MSRHNCGNEKYQFTYGLDHALGPYFQIWAHPSDGEDAPILSGDNMGIHADPEQAWKMTPPIARILLHTEERFRQSVHYGNSRPNLDAETINNFAEACGIMNMYSAIADSLDAAP